jgi:anti-sigma regulatory factor (Ser/Thr protein kinase)
MSRELSPELVLLDREYDGATSTLRSARNDVVDALDAQLSDQELQERAELVVSELATNAIQASPGTAYGLRVSLDGDGAVVIAVTSHTQREGPPPRSAWGPTHPMALRGRGLLIVDKLTDEVDVQRSAADTLVVTATFRTARIG